MRQAIKTKYIGPTDTTGPMVSASYAGGSEFLPWDHSLGNEDNHWAAANFLINKLGWNLYNDFEGGSFDDCYYFVAIPKKGEK